MKRHALLLALAGCASKSDARPSDPPRGILGVKVGETTASEAKDLLQEAGLRCDDASLMAMMREAHARHGVPAAPAGELPPGQMPSGHEQFLKDPALMQARITCTGLRVAELDDREDAPADAPVRVLLVADTATAPLRLLALQRTYTDGARALADARVSFAALGRRYGAPSESKGELGAALVEMTPVRRTWTFPTLVVEAKAVDLGATGVSVSEEIRTP